MRLLNTCLLVTLLSTPLQALSLTFEQRSPILYRARLGNEALIIHPDSLTFGGVTLRFANASSSSRLEGIGAASPATYLDSRTSRTFLQFPKLALRRLYPGVDVILYGHGEHLEYDLVVSPGADLNRLRIGLDGARKIQVDGEGNLKVETDSGDFTQMLPRVFQSDGRQIPARYALRSKNEVGFRVGPHNPRLSLTIDPELVFTKYFGGSASDSASAITTDAQGNIYIAGTSNSVDFPTTNGTHWSRAPLAAISGDGQTVTAVPVGTETSVLAIGGTPDGRVIYAVTPDAVYVSSDQGATWAQNAPLPASNVNNISVDEIDPSRVFVATSKGLYFSSQAGEGWYLYNGLPTGGNGLVNATSVLLSPVNRAIVYVVTAQPAALFKSADYGSTWTPLDPGTPRTPFLQPYVATVDPNGDLFIIDPYGTLLKSTDEGVTWRQLGSQLPGAAQILIDPANPSNIYVATSSGIQKSNDGGITFVKSTVPGGVKQMALDSSSGTLYFGTPTGVTAISTGATLISTQSLHSLVALGSQLYAGFDTPPIPYVIKWDPTGTNILYSTFFGGTILDLIRGLAVDAQGNCTVAGATYSPDFPVTTKLSNSQTNPSGFVTRLSADGTRLVYSDLLGGSGNTQIQGLALDSSGAAYVTGQTSSADFPVSANAFQPARPQPTCNRPQYAPFIRPDTGVNAFVSKISPDGSQFVYSTLITGSCGSWGQSLAVNGAGEAVVAGFTTSTDFPITAGSYQSVFPGLPDQILPPNALEAGFAARISAGGDRLIAGTYLGGSYETQANSVALDSRGNIYLTGLTAKILPGATLGAYQAKAVDRCAYPFSPGPSSPYGGTNDAFVLKLDPTLSTAGYLTYLGGGCDDSGTFIALDSFGNAWLTGLTQSPDFPLKSPFQGAGISGRFVSEISADGSQLLFSSATDGASLAIDPMGVVHLAGSGSISPLPKHVQQFSVTGTAAEWNKIDPAATLVVVIDNVQPVTAYPPSVLARSSLGSGVVPGELIQITGHNLGPSTQANGQLDSTGRMPFTLAGTTVLFDNIPAPIVSVEDTAVICFAPFEVSQAANVTVESNGRRSNSVRMGVRAGPDVQILSVINPDGTSNGGDHPANRGDVVVFYVSGLGETKPLSIDGLVNTPPLPVPIASLTVAVTGTIVKPEFVGAAPGQIAGIVQVNVRLPLSNYSGLQTISLNDAGATVYVSQ
jgi:uncharacterized protein (TIGR03437 family)